MTTVLDGSNKRGASPPRSNPSQTPSDARGGKPLPSSLGRGNNDIGLYALPLNVFPPPRMPGLPSTLGSSSSSLRLSAGVGTVYYMAPEQATGCK